MALPFSHIKALPLQGEVYCSTLQFCCKLRRGKLLNGSLKKWSHFALKSGVTGGTKIRSGITSNWRIFESK